MNPTTHDHPLPGDLVIRHAPHATAAGRTAFVVVTHPDTGRFAGPYRSLTLALHHARALAQERSGLVVWREDGGSGKPAYENVSETKS